MAKTRWKAEQFLSTLRRPRMPVTVGFVQARTGMAEHQARRIRNELVERGALVPVDKYQGKKHGFWVTVYRVIQPRASVTASVRRTRTVKPRFWWQHPLFGTPDGEPPPGTPRKQRKRWRSGLFRAYEKERAWPTTPENASGSTFYALAPVEPC